MKGILLDKVGGDYHLVDNLDKPKPGMGQLLVKSLVAGLNPVEGFQRSGILVDSWPMVLGCDASGVIVEIGADVAKFKEGDAVFACTRLGAKGFGTFQEYFLVDAHLAFKKPDNISSEEAATIGVGVLTAGLALFGGLKLSLENKANNSEWIVILGSAGAVGQYAVQLAKLCGFRVLAFCSPSNGELVKSLGADAILSHKIAINDQLKGIASITGGNFVRLFDASAMAGEFGMQALADHGAKDRTKYFATTNDWEPVRARNGIEVDMVALGLIGKSGIAKAEIVNSAIESFIPKFEEHFKNGGLKPMKYERVGNVGVEEVLKGLNAFNTRKSDGKKLIVRLAKE